MMHEVQPGSVSIIVRSTHIFLLSVEAAAVGSWMPESNKIQKRAVDLTLHVEEVLKGKIQKSPGDTINIEVIQFRPAIARFFAVPGAWSSKTLDSGSQYVAFCNSQLEHPKEILVEPERIIAADSALSDVRIALSAEKENLQITELLDRIESKKPSLGGLFAEYVTAKIADILFKKVRDFDAMMDFIEDPKLSANARDPLLENMYSRFLASDPAPEYFTSRLVIGTMKVISMPEAAALHENMLQVYLPNLLGLEGGSTKKTAAEIFHDYPEEREKAEKILLNYHNPESAKLILEWLRS